MRLGLFRLCCGVLLVATLGSLAPVTAAQVAPPPAAPADAPPRTTPGIAPDAGALPPPLDILPSMPSPPPPAPALPVVTAPPAPPPAPGGPAVTPPEAPPLQVAPLPPPSPLRPHPVIALAVDLGPGPLLVGETVPFTISVQNAGDAPADDLAVTLPAPAGAVALRAAPAPTGGWSWTPGTLAPGAQVALTGTLQLTGQPPGAALQLTPQATARDLTPVTTRGGAVVTTALTPARARFMPGRPATLTSPDGAVTVSFPADAGTTALTLSHQPLRSAAPSLRARGTPVPSAHAGSSGSYG